MKEIGESIYVKIIYEQTLSKIETVWAKDAEGLESPTKCECLQSDYQRSGKTKIAGIQV